MEIQYRIMCHGETGEMRFPEIGDPSIVMRSPGGQTSGSAAEETPDSPVPGDVYSASGCGGHSGLKPARTVECADIPSPGHPDQSPYDPETLDYINTLMADGRWTPAVIDRIEQLKIFQPADGINRDELIGSAIKDIAAPHTINQDGKRTCVATSVQIALAARNPERYLQILTALAGREGNASAIVKGLRREPDTPIADDGTGRSITTRLMTPAFMEYGGIGNYHDGDDLSHLAGPLNYSGLYSLEGTHLYKGIMGEQAFTSGSLLNLFITPLRGRTYRKIQEALDENRAVRVDVKWEKLGLHSMYLNRLSDEFAYVVNPWGERDKIPASEFRKGIVSATISRSGNSAPMPLAWSDWSSYKETHIRGPFLTSWPNFRSCTADPDNHS